MMRRAGLLALPLLVVLSGAVCAEPPPEPRKGTANTMDSPFEIRAALDRSLNLKATLVNRSAGPQLVLHDRNLQPSALVVTDAQGTAVAVTDSRDVEKFDNTIRRAAYKSVPAGGTFELFAARATKSSGRYALTWGPYQFRNVAPGHYKARVRWTSAESTYVGEDGTVHTLAGIWQGVVASPVFDLRLP